MRVIPLGLCLVVAVTLSFTANQLIAAALGAPRLPDGVTHPLPEPERRPLDTGRLARLLGTPLRPAAPVAPRRALPLKLLGTLDAHAAAVLDPATGQCRTLRVGDAWDDVELVEVGHGIATVRRGGALEALGGRAPVPAARGSAGSLSVAIGSRGATVQLSRAELEQRLEEFAGRLLSGARVVPTFTGGAMTGLKLFAVRPGSIYEELGLKSGDVIETVNGAPVAGLDLGLGSLTQLRNGPRVQVGVNRGGDRLSWELNLN